MKMALGPVALAIILFCSPIHTMAQPHKISDEQVKELIIQESISSYPGRCPCPCNVARNGSQCGKRSAWSRAGGYAPICYKSEISTQMMAEWRQQKER
ncbi:hypothetical protein JMY81_03380 [Brenneria goodwinii]|uniref:hypothetical protein n=1 Tax=Brenneria goodwinii TaxID=1109412 RepID=UPI000EF1D9C6|nr:hypothetical protein [Brenneria goodwinii]MCG8159879.1 hypothetical protein [Brenneria goodwinii]MCG8164022.1 hypothetical protein [Brenneria goodwinii]MCG8168631.1 hypothetical protein [Brenneria goodwinii]MCG8173814.1 hypothetical protein [Brenneria goodwinii]